MTLYACLHLAEFPAQALLRLQPSLRAQPVAVMEGRAPLEAICSLNRPARRLGAALGMTRLEAESLPGLQLLARNPQVESAAHNVLFEAAARFSPRIENLGTSTSAALILDITGTERLFGPPQSLAERLNKALATLGFRASIAVSASFHTARILAAATRGITLIPTGQESPTLAPLPLASLNLSADDAQTFANWGIRTLGELAALPQDELIARLGQRALHWHQLALGTAPHSFQPVEPAFQLQEFFEFETPVADLDSLLFLGARMIDSLVARASARAFSLARLILHMELEKGAVCRRVIAPAIPSIDRKFLLKLLQLQLAANPPSAAVQRITLRAEAGQSSKVQLGLFAPQTPEPSRLDVTIARLKAIAGEDRVGSPVLEDTHRPGSFHLAPFAIPAKPQKPTAGRNHLALRRMRPPIPVRVTLQAEKPTAFRDRQHTYAISAAYGPWKTSGAWWAAEGWDLAEWDVLAQAAGGESLACLLVEDRQTRAWHLEAFYD